MPFVKDKTKIKQTGIVILDFGLETELYLGTNTMEGNIVITLNETRQGLFSNASETEESFITSGSTAQATIPIASVMDLDLQSRIFHGAEVDMGTDADGDPVVTGVGYGSSSGCQMKGRPCLIKLVNCGVPTENPAGWFYFPNAILFTDNSTITLSKTEQAVMNLMLYGMLPEDELDPFAGIRLYRGDYTQRLVPTSFDQAFTFSAAPASRNTTDGGAEIGITVTIPSGNISPMTKFEINALPAPYDGNAINNQLFLSNTQVLSIDTFDNYLGKPYVYTHTDGKTYSNTIKSGRTDMALKP